MNQMVQKMKRRGMGMRVRVRVRERREGVCAGLELSKGVSVSVPNKAEHVQNDRSTK